MYKHSQIGTIKPGAHSVLQRGFFSQSATALTLALSLQADCSPENRGYGVGRRGKRFSSFFLQLLRCLHRAAKTADLNPG